MTWAIEHGDAVDLLAGLPAGSFDACVCDPPYGENAASWDKPKGLEWHAAWVAAVDRVLKPGAPLVAFGSRRYLDLIMGAIRDVRGDTPGRPLQTAVWAHRQGHTSRDGFLRPEHEPVVISGCLRVDADDVRRCRGYRSPHNIARKSTHRKSAARGFGLHTYTPHELGPIGGTVFDCGRNKPAEATGHPTQKPEEVMEYFVLLACPPGGSVIDPFAGSGTTGYVAVRHGRSFWGCDENAGYVEMARRRIGGPLFLSLSESAPSCAQGE